jgi:hypothetical protein
MPPRLYRAAMATGEITQQLSGGYVSLLLICFAASLLSTINANLFLIGEGFGFVIMRYL